MQAIEEFVYHLVGYWLPPTAAIASAEYQARAQGKTPVRTLSATRHGAVWTVRLEVLKAAT